jgi:hypothetical protein
MIIRKKVIGLRNKILDVVKFIGESFFTPNIWRLFRTDDARFGKWASPLTYVRNFILLNGIVDPLLLIRGDPIRPVAIFLDWVLLPFLSVLGLQISKCIPDVGKWSYTSDKAQVIVLMLGAISNEIDQTWADNHSVGARIWNMQWGSVAHRILLPLFILRFFTIYLAVFDWRLKLQVWLRVLSVLTVFVIIGGLIYGYIDFAQM